MVEGIIHHVKAFFAYFGGFLYRICHRWWRRIVWLVPWTRENDWPICGRNNQAKDMDMPRQWLYAMGWTGWCINEISWGLASVEKGSFQWTLLGLTRMVRIRWLKSFKNYIWPSWWRASGCSSTIKLGTRGYRGTNSYMKLFYLFGNVPVVNNWITFQMTSWIGLKNTKSR